MTQVTLRILSMKYEHVRQNISYTCDAGMDGYLAVLLETITGEKMDFSHKAIRLVSEVGPRNANISCLQPQDACIY